MLSLSDPYFSQVQVIYFPLQKKTARAQVTEQLIMLTQLVNQLVLAKLSDLAPFLLCHDIGILLEDFQGTLIQQHTSYKEK